MSDGDLPDLPPDIAALLHDARDVPASPAADRRKVAARLALTTGLAIPGAAVAGAKLFAGVWVTRAVGLAVAVVALGGVAVGTLRSPARPAHVPTPIARPVIPPPSPAVPPSPVSVAAPSPAPVVAPLPVVAPSPAVQRPPSAPRAVDDTDLDAELALIEQAHGALARSDFAAARAALARHAARHPRGRLTPEREALRVQCLAAQGERGAAETARQRFHQRFPASVLGAAVDRAVDATP
jgi:hypothetical protein